MELVNKWYFYYPMLLCLQLILTEQSHFASSEQVVLFVVLLKNCSTQRRGALSISCQTAGQAGSLPHGDKALTAHRPPELDPGQTSTKKK